MHGGPIQVAKNCDILFIAVKPNIVGAVLQEVGINKVARLLLRYTRKLLS
jgi:pyrroline-5-carboxylate reductase